MTITFSVGQQFAVVSKSLVIHRVFKGDMFDHSFFLGGGGHLNLILSVLSTICFPRKGNNFIM